ncbi:sulfatase-like hydrolase/transferase [Paenibacillus sp. SYP-B3998]|uniref:Sulfatase-like hydrolase/transferase n=1 Tax=Paenibacillus sp. SYP-B3998 TaxID=2678564 RepID=A0A6G3ZUH4_9BACL|nr:alkaline phosphatase family protein [Paenibacillus sp. SYP-B3998]NEW05067.1 sulfatase-like hydrolase/transferase [Paenibacillus sp. SYP-B3998]
MTGTTIKRVFILGIDGAGAFNRETETPHIDALLQAGARTDSAQTVFPSNSGECWGALLHGVTPDRHRSHTYIKEEQHYPKDSATPSLFSLIKKASPGSKMASFVSWKPILTGIIEDDSDIHKYAAPDDELVPAIVTYIHENPDLKLLFVQLDDVDYAGHRHGYGSAEYLTSISKADQQIGAITVAIREAGLLDDSLIIVTTDHGGGGVDDFNHGSDHEKDMTIFWGCRGPGVHADADLSGLSIMDTAAVTLRALGLPPLANADAKLPNGLFPTVE